MLKRPIFILIILVVLVILGGLAFLATWNIPAPSARIEKVVPNDRLPR